MLKNLLSNAFKFTERGHVALAMGVATSGWSPDHPVLSQAGKVIAFTVSDSGIGIPANKQQIIFEAFQQADGSTSRKYGGTGLGLSISREIARLLGGEIRLASTPGEGSAFTLYLPAEYVRPPSQRLPRDPAPFFAPAPEAPAASANLETAVAALPAETVTGVTPGSLPDDRATLAPGDRVLLIIEGAPNFANILMDLARDKGFKALATIKNFVDQPVKRLLIVEDDPVQRGALIELKGNGDVETTAVATAEEAWTLLGERHFDCMVLDLVLPGMSGLDFIDRLREDSERRGLPIIIYTAKDLTPEEQVRLKRATDAIVLKSATSPERLLDETALFLHRIESALPESQRRLLRQARHEDPALANRKVLVVDDDLRNIFALTAVLEQHKMNVVFAENGRDAVGLLQRTPDIDVALMDIMMPEMDGYETMRTVRALGGRFAKLPMIALTTKAMKGDREKCIEAGASDYVSKPVDTEQLLSLLRVWLYT